MRGHPGGQLLPHRYLGAELKMMELTTKFDSRKSFYRKAHYRREDEKIILRSYETDVLEYDSDTGEFREMWGGNSQTTNRHIREFVRQIQGGDIR